MKGRSSYVLVGFLSLALSLAPLTLAQTSAQTASALPRMVRFGGTVKDLNGSVLTGVVGITFALYSEQSGGAALWLETQNATADSSGHYTVLLGSTKPEGLPAELFTSEQAHWVGVQVSGQAEQPRLLLVSAPYALKAGDAETVGGFPASAFVLAAPAIAGSTASNATAGTVTPLAATDVTTSGGAVGYLPIFSGADTIVDSVVFQSAASPFKIGINTATPATALDVNGAGTIRGTLSLPATGVATATAGKSSQGLNLTASSFSSTSSTAVNQVFRLLAEAAANDTTAPSGTLNLQYGLGATTPTETGLKVSSKGIVTFATGQTFPGIGDGSVTSVATGLGLKGGPITKTGTLTIDTTVVPQLAVANTFTASQTVNGNLTATGTAKAATLSATSANISNSLSINSGIGGPLNVVSSAIGGQAIIALSSASTGEGSGVLGLVSSGDPGATGVYGYATSSTGSPVGVYGQSNAPLGTGVYGTGGTGVVGVSTGPNLAGISPLSGPGGSFTGYSAPSGSQVDGSNGAEVYGGGGDPSLTDMSEAGEGIMAVGGSGTFNSSFGGPGVGGVFTGGNCTGCLSAEGIVASPGATGLGVGDAAYFGGNVQINGMLNGSNPAIKIDDPLDPANKYLLHAPVQSSEMMNIYTGNITSDGQGHAVVQLPEWFEVLNTDFRYQLTVIGQFAQAIIGRKIENNQFEIRTSAPNVEVSWQVTGVRQDAYAKANPLVVEQEKDARLRGFYMHPELYGAPAEKQIEWARHPQMMKRIKEMQAGQLAAAQKAATLRSASPRK
jgi:hypothetical protein